MLIHCLLGLRSHVLEKFGEWGLLYIAVYCVECMLTWLSFFATGSGWTESLSKSSTFFWGGSSYLSDFFVLLKEPSLSESDSECSSSDGSLGLFPDGSSDLALFSGRLLLYSTLLIKVKLFDPKFVRVEPKVSFKALKLDCWDC